MSIEAKHYGETRRRLMADPIVRDMAGGVAHLALDQLAHDGESPRFEFMTGANAEYRARLSAAGRTDDQPRHIGAVAEAILALLGKPEPGQYGYEGPCDQHGDSCDNDHDEEN